MTDANPAPDAQQTQLNSFDDVSSLMKGAAKLKTEQDEDQLNQSLKTFLTAVAKDAEADGALIADNIFDSVGRAKAALDKVINAQLNEILHHEEFQTLESAWMGLHFMVNNTETGTDLKIRVMNVTKDELFMTLKKFRGALFDQSPLFKAIYSSEYDMLGGTPYGMLVGDFQFDHGAKDVMILEEMAKIGSACHCPFITGGSPNLFRLDSWDEVMKPVDLAKIQDNAQFAAWKGLRDLDDSRFLGICAPRFMVRPPYDPEENPVPDLAFVEDIEGGDGKKFAWANAAYARAVNITRSFKDNGWCTRIIGVESGGATEGLPVVTFEADHGGVVQKCPTEVAITERRENEMSNLGIMAMVHRKESNNAVYFSGQSLHKPVVWDDAAANESEELSAGLNYLFASCRFTHYLKAMVRDKIGGFDTQAQLEQYLKRWISNYIVGNPDQVGDEVKAKKPLRDAQVIVTPVDGKPGEYSASFKITPHYQLKSMDITMSLTGTLNAGG